MWRSLILGVTLSAALTMTGHSANLTSSVSKDGRDVISLDGEISEGDYEQFNMLIKNSNQSNRIVSGIRLNSIGGNLAEGAKLAKGIRYAKIATVVPNNKICASACFLAFAAGSEKFASFTAQIGIHGASAKGGIETTNSGAATVLMARYAKELGVPEPIIGKMVVTPASQIAWLNPNELRSMGTTLTGKQRQSAPDIENNQPPIQQSITALTPPKIKWSDVVSAALEISSAQNGGKARFDRVCQPELKVCNTVIFYKNPEKNDIMLRLSEDANGKFVSRDICEFNSFDDIRVCTDWDTKVTNKSMKGSDGRWKVITAD